MDSVEAIKKFTDLIEQDYAGILLDAKTKSRLDVTVDFNKVLQFDPLLGDYMLDEPVDALKAFEIACEKYDDDLKGITVRLKNAQKYTKVPINEVRTQHINKLITVEGMVKQKSDVKGLITSAKFECPSCGNIINVLQLDERHFKEPSKCGCGRKGKFNKLAKDMVNVYSLMVEEPTDIIVGGTKLSQIKVVCKGSLTRPEVERMVYQGVRIEITGLLTELQIQKQGQNTSRVDWYLDANYVKVYDESFTTLKWTKKEEEQFKELAEKPNWLGALRKSIFYDIHGYEEEAEGIILQMFAGVGKARQGAKVRGNFHILLVGDPGGAKSTLLKIAQKFAPKAMYVAGTGVSGVGLSATVVRDELIGGYTLEAGALVLCNNGLLCLDELDKVDDVFKKALHEPLAEETVSVSKANIHATLIAQTSVLAAANPKHGSYSEYDSIYSQIDLATTLINRFDLVYPIREAKLSTEDDYEIAMKILSRASVDENIAPEYEREFIKKYIAFARRIEPVMPLHIQEFIARRYQKIKEAKKKKEGSNSIPISARNVDGFRRVIEAVAKSRLHETVTEEDAEIGYRKILYSIEQVGIDPDSGDVVQDWVIGKPMAEKDIHARIISVIRKYSDKNQVIDVNELFAILNSDGISDENKIEEVLGKLKHTGDIFEPKPGKYQIMR